MPARRHLVIGAGHIDGFPGGQIVQREINSAPAVVARTLRGIGDEDLALRRCGVPEYFRDVPGAISDDDKHAVPKRQELVLNGKQRLGRWAWQEGPGVAVNRVSEEIERRNI